MITAFFRTAILYLLLIVGIRLTGKRQIGELEPIELVLTMLLSDLASVPMQDFGIPLVNGVIPIVTLLSMSMLLSCFSLHSVRFRALICGKPAIIIQDGKECTPRGYIIGEINKNLTRAALCQLGVLHYVMVTVNMEPYAVCMPTLKQFATRLWELGIPTAYSLDGGQTATIVMEGTLINSVDYGDQRDISDIIYFATALPEVE